MLAALKEVRAANARPAVHPHGEGAGVLILFAGRDEGELARLCLLVGGIQGLTSWLPW